MNATLTDWCGRAWSALDTQQEQEGLRSKWEEHSCSEHLVVTLFGPYDSGKSSLLKRILVDGGASVPDWLTVSGRRETFTCSEAIFGNLAIRDTPGIAGGNAQHQRAAREAVALTDVIVLTLPPQLVTSEKQLILEILTGAYFNCPAEAAYASGSLIIAISRMDEAGVNPRDDLAGYNLLVSTKLQELRQFLKVNQVLSDSIPVYAIAADPFSLVGNEPVDGPEDYDADRNWDGISSLLTHLESLAERRAEMHLHAETRFLATELSAVATSLQQSGTGLRLAADASLGEVRAQNLEFERFQALMCSARADLESRIEDEVATASQQASETEELRQKVLTRVEKGLDLWTAKHDSLLNQLVKEANAESSTRQTRPDWKKLADLLATPRKPTIVPQEEGTGSTLKTLEQVARIAHEGFKQVQPLTLGMTLEKACEELRSLQSVGGSFDAYVAQAGKQAGRLADAAHATRAKRAVMIDAGFAVAIPVLLQLGGLMHEMWSEQGEAKKRAQERESARRVVENCSKALAKEAWNLWYDERPAALLKAMNAVKSSAEETAAALTSESEVFFASHASIQQLLQDLTLVSRDV